MPQPPANLTVQPNASVSISVTATKGIGPLVYQWFKSGVPLTDSGKVSGSHTATLNLSSVAGADTGSGLYYVVVANVDSVGYVTNTPASINFPVGLVVNITRALAIRTMGSSILFQLPAGTASAQITLLDVWGRPVWSRSLGHGIDQVTWNGNSAGGSRSTGAGLYIVRMVLFDAQQHQMGILERKVSYTP